MSQTNDQEADELRPEYDFTGGVRGKHYAAYQAGTNVVLLDADVARAFPDSSSVNRALRLLLEVAEKQLRRNGRHNIRLHATPTRRSRAASRRA